MEVGFRADAIRDLMQREGLDLNGFVLKSGFSRQLVGLWMGGTTCPRWDTLIMLCNRFNVMPEFFAAGLTVKVEPSGDNRKRKR